MPKIQPTVSWQELRNFMEAWNWEDAKTGVTVMGFNPPENARNKRQKPFYCKYITGKGEVEEGEMVCLKVYPRLHQRMVQFTRSKEIRRIRDYLVMEVEGIRVITH